MRNKAFLEEGHAEDLQNGVEACLQPQTLLDDRHEDINGDGNPYLGLYGILGRAKEGLDPQMLFDPLEEEFHLPAAPIELRDDFRREVEIVGQKGETLVPGCIVEADAAELFWIILPAVKANQSNDLVALHAGRAVYLLRIEPAEAEVAFAPRDEEAAGLVQRIKPGEVYVPTVHDVDRTWLHEQVVENVDVVDFAMGDEYDRGDAPFQVHQRVQFYGPFSLAKLRPGEQRKTEVDDRGIEGIDGMRQVHAKILSDVEGSGNANQDLCKVRIDSPVAHVIGVGQRVAADGAPEPHVVQLWAGRGQAVLNASKALPKGELGEGHREKLVPAREALDLEMAVVAVDALAELVRRQEVHQLGEDGLSLIHRPYPPGTIGKYGSEAEPR